MKIKKLLKRKLHYLYFLLVLTIIFKPSAFAQQLIVVSGTVTSADDGNTLPGVTISVKGKQVTTVTDINGKYTIKANTGEMLVFSFIGMKNRTIAVNKTTLDVALEQNTIGLQEVVAIGYGSVKKKELTGAVSSVTAKDLENIVTSDLGTALQGQIAGLNVISSSGAPGAQSEILIRGITSVTGSNTPLFVVDGVPQEDNPNISPNEIEKIDILKDAASTAIYGSRGAAGVILITTKQGKTGNLKVNFSGSSGVQHITSRAVPLMNTAEQIFFDITEAKNRAANPLPDDQINLGFDLLPNKLVYDTNISEEIILDNQPVHNYTMGINGGGKEMSYNVTGGYYYKKGTLINSDFGRFNMRANTSYKKDKWNINASLGVTYENEAKTPNNLIVQALKYSPTLQPLYGLSPDEVIITDFGAGGVATNNILESLNNTDDNNNAKSLVNVNAQYEVIKNLKISSRVGLTSVNSYEHFFNPYQEVYDVFNKFLTQPQSSGVTMTALRRKSISVDGLATYKLDLKEHVFNFTAGLTYENYFFSRFSASGNQVFNNKVKTLNGTTLNPTNGSGPDYSTTLLGTLFRVQYDLKDKYHLSASIRRDGSSKFSKENRYGIFPSAAFAWNISDEKFWKPLSKFINDAKFRITAGTVGNQSFDDYSYAAGLTTGYDYAFGRSGSDNFQSGAIQTKFANPRVKWETSIQQNIGLDLGFFNNKLTATIDYYIKDNKDMLFPLTLPLSAGGNQVILNVGNMTNKGFEFASSYRTKYKKVNLTLSGTFTTNNNKITKINGLGGFLYTDDTGLVSGAKDQSQVTTLAEGYEAGAFFLYRTNGIIDTHEKLANYQKLDPTARMGDLIYKDTNNDGVLSDADRTYSGSGLPEYEFGFNLRADYKGFDISANLYSAIGQEIMNGSRANAFAYGRAKDLVYVWSAENQLSPVPRYNGDIKADDNYKGYTDLWLEDGSYLRFKEITLGYTLNKKTSAKLGTSSIRVFATAQNPFTITKYTGFDPEIGGGLKSRGLDKGNYPTTSFYSLGLNVNF